MDDTPTSAPAYTNASSYELAGLLNAHLLAVVKEVSTLCHALYVKGGAWCAVARTPHLIDHPSTIPTHPRYVILFTFILVRVTRLRFRYALVTNVSTIGACVWLLVIIQDRYEQEGTEAGDTASEITLFYASELLVVVTLAAMVTRITYEDEKGMQMVYLAKVGSGWLGEEDVVVSSPLAPPQGVLQMKFFCGRFNIPSFYPEHLSKTCIVLRAIDTGDDGEQEEDVVRGRVGV